MLYILNEIYGNFQDSRRIVVIKGRYCGVSLGRDLTNTET